MLQLGLFNPKKFTAHIIFNLNIMVLKFIFGVKLLIQFPAPMTMPQPMTRLKYARAYVLDQPYTCVVPPAEALKHGTMFPFLLDTYIKSLKAADKGVTLWKP